MIPKILHRICLGQSARDETHLNSFTSRWRELHPSWELRLWTDDNLPRLQNRKLFYACSNGGHQADILRYELLFRFGGVYVDLDIEPLRPLDDLLASGLIGFAGRIEPQNREIGKVELETAVLGAGPRLPFFGYLLERITPWTVKYADQRVSLRTGPQFFQWHLNRWREETGHEGVTLLPSQYFYPYRADQLERATGPFPNSYAVHRWWSSWKTQPGAW